MNPPVPTLRELQHAMRRSLPEGVNEEASAWIVADGLDAGKRLSIYRNTFAGVLGTALRLAFPAVHQLVGPDFFEGAAGLFVAQAPPRNAWLDEYGAEFPDFLERLPQAASVPYLADVARLEWQVNLVLHAPDAPPLDISRLAALSNVAPAQLHFEPHPAVRLLRCEFPIDVIWRAVLERDDCAMATVNLAEGPVWLLAHRTQSGIEVKRLGKREWHFTAALFSGKSFFGALEDAPCDDAHTVLATHLARGCLADVSVVPSALANEFRRTDT
ncbi:DNA-binding domain-containing protein [Caballeronia sp. SEWSISQ10-4 2]|uniref:HvfC/BufC N-terminal domain-containing protein n=1 Tax=Caballeronia sp. SEWSISQ10-4 2 TaxID=2937438 RepID=UPI00264DCF32|nr:DNA-binding domain-containing protein [Caballeronia sp. SEWSISQ10-4 2]MDN7176855.1 DNA-binding domain-containing protein [Caballeronia sp. SEWSISQ10-4 2]